MKRFLIKWCIFFAPIFAVTGYFLVTQKTEHTGDLGKLGNISFGYDYDRNTRAFEMTHDIQSILVDVDSASTYPLLLIGDSFLEPQFALGHSLSQELGDTMHVVNTARLSHQFAPTKALLYGLTHKCFSPGQVIILETIERSLADRFARLDFGSPTLPDDICRTDLWRQAQAQTCARLELLRDHTPTQSFEINDLLTWLRLLCHYKHPLRQYTLVKPMFTHDQYADQLFVYKDDFDSCNLPDETLDCIAASASALSQMAEAQGIRLYLLVIPDKYDLYHPYIADREGLPVPNALDFISRGGVRIINARDSLAPLLEQGEMDVWRVNDSHWSVKTSEYIARKIAARLKADSVLVSSNPCSGTADAATDDAACTGRPTALL